MDLPLSFAFAADLPRQSHDKRMTVDQMADRMFDFMILFEDGPLSWWNTTQADDRGSFLPSHLSLCPINFFWDGVCLYGVKAWAESHVDIDVRVGCLSIFPVEGGLNDALVAKRMTSTGEIVAANRDGLVDGDPVVIHHLPLARGMKSDSLARHLIRWPVMRMWKVRGQKLRTIRASDPRRNRMESIKDWLLIVAGAVSDAGATMTAPELAKTAQSFSNIELTMFLGDAKEIQKTILGGVQCAGCGIEVVEAATRQKKKTSTGLLFALQIGALLLSRLSAPRLAAPQARRVR